MENLIAERSLLGCLIIDNDSILDIAEFKIKPSDFSSATNSIIFQEIIGCHTEKTPFDYIILSSRLIHNGKIDSLVDDKNLGQNVILNLVENQASSANIKAYAKIVKKSSDLRKFKKVLTDASNEIKNSSDIENIISDTNKKILDIIQSNGSKSVPIYKLSLKLLDDLANGKTGETIGRSTGYSNLDNKILGLQHGKFYIIAARPAMGKTSFALNIAKNSYDKSNLPVLFFTIEMSSKDITERMISFETEIEYKKIRTATVDKNGLKKIGNTVNKLKDCKFFIYDQKPLTIYDIQAEARRVKNEFGLGLVVVDYIQLIRTTSGNNREQQIAEISRELKMLSMELDCPLIALAQLNRAVESRIEKRPSLSDLRESGSLEQDADAVLMLYRDEYYNPQTTKLRGIAEVSIVKNRFGESGIISLGFKGECFKFIPTEYISIKEKDNYKDL